MLVAPVQAWTASNAAKAEKEHDRWIAEVDKQAMRSGLELERVRDQMEKVLKPNAVMLGTALTIENYLWHELELPSSAVDLSSLVVRPADADHIEVISRGGPVYLKRMLRTPYVKYTRADIEVLDNDVGKLQRFVEVTRDCLVPLYLGFAKLWETTNHLCEFTSLDKTLMAKLPPQLGLNFSELLMNATQSAWIDMRTYALNWIPIIKRWEVQTPARSLCMQPQSVLRCVTP